MYQSGLMPPIEAIAIALVGYGLAVLTQALVFSLIGLAQGYELDPLHGGDRRPRL
jgi:hypothetical protein